MLFAWLTIRGVFVADWSVMSCVSQSGPPDCGQDAIQLWSLAGCDLFYGCNVPGWAELFGPLAVAMLWSTAAMAAGVLAHAAMFARGRRVPRYATVGAVLPFVAAIAIVALSARVWPWDFDHGVNVGLGSAPSVLILAHLVGGFFVIYVGVRSRMRATDPPVPRARAR